jgi:hypothetical protein
MRPITMLLAAFLLTAPAPLLAQVNETGEIYVGEPEQDDDDGNSRLGLLGLLGLAGLLGLRRREPDIHVDARRDTRA